MIKCFDAVSKAAAISLVSLNLTLKYYKDAQIKLFQHLIKFHTDQLKSVWENETNRFLLYDDLVISSQGQAHRMLYKTVEVNGVYKHDRCEKYCRKVCM